MMNSIWRFMSGCPCLMKHCRISSMPYTHRNTDAFTQPGSHPCPTHTETLTHLHNQYPPLPSPPHHTQEPTQQETTLCWHILKLCMCVAVGGCFFLEQLSNCCSAKSWAVYNIWDKCVRTRCSIMDKASVYRGYTYHGLGLFTDGRDGQYAVQSAIHIRDHLQVHKYITYYL